MKIRVYDMVINENDETGVDINSFVSAPAHMRSFETYDKNKKIRFSIDTEKRIVTGVFILANFLIYREDKQLGIHWVKFSPQVIESIRNKFFITDSNKNKNTEHEGLFVKGATLVESYIVHSTDPKHPRVPEMLAKQGVTDYSWVGSYYIQDEVLWQDCKKGIFKGFSVEGYFDKKENKIKSAMKKTEQKKKSIFHKIFGSNAEDFAEVKTVDGTSLFYEGELEKGTVMMIEANGEKIPAPAGDYQCEEDGKTYAITLNDKGEITEVAEATVMSEDTEAMSAAMKKLYTDATKSFTEMGVKFKAMQKEIDVLTKEIGILKGDEKFTAKPKKTADGKDKKSFKDLLAKK